MSKHAAESYAEPVPLQIQLAQAQETLAAHSAFADSGEINVEAVQPEAVADNIFDTLGIVRSDAIQPWESHAGPEARLERASDVAKEALAVGYDRDASDEHLTQVGKDLVGRLVDLKHRGGSDPDLLGSEDYNRENRTLTLLVEATARELGRRHNVGDSLTMSNLRDIQNETGINLEYTPRGYQAVGSVISSRDFQIQPYIASTGKHQVRSSKPAPTGTTKPADPTYSMYYQIPELASPQHGGYVHGGWVLGRRGSGAVLAARYTGGRIPR